MTSSKPHRMLIRGAVVGALACASLLSCQERLATGEAQDEHSYWCTVVNAAQVYDEQGDALGLVLDPEGNQTHLCWCLTLEQGLSGDWNRSVNDRAYEVCLESAAAMGYPEANDCADYHAVNHWGDKMFGLPDPSGESCDPAAASAAGCNVE